MLASITPLGERGRRSTWGVTVTAFLVGATGAAASAGALAGALGRLIVPGGGASARVVALAAALALALLVDLVVPAAPGPRRQVDERWLDRYRGWVYGLGFGAQLGLGVTTIVSSAAMYAALVAAFLAGPADGAVIFGCFGAVRGLTPLAAAHVRSTGQLVALHRALERWRGRVRRGATVALGAAFLAGVVAAVALA